MMKIGVSSYSFQAYIACGKMTQLDTIAKAKEMGFDAIEFAEPQLPAGVDLAEYAEKLKQEAQKQNIPIVNLAVSADFLNGSGGDTAKEIRRVRGIIDAAQTLGTPCVRHDCTAGQGDENFAAVLPILADACREVTIYAAGKGIRTTVENHGLFCQDSERMARLHAAVGHPNFGLLVDMGNFLCVDEAPTSAVRRLAPLAVHVHAKDFLFQSGRLGTPDEGFFATRGGNYLCGTIIGHGCVPVSECLAILKQVGYDGIVSVEFEGKEDCETGIREGLASMRRYIQEM